MVSDLDQAAQVWRTSHQEGHGSAPFDQFMVYPLGVSTERSGFGDQVGIFVMMAVITGLVIILGRFTDLGLISRGLISISSGIIVGGITAYVLGQLRGRRNR